MSTAQWAAPRAANVIGLGLIGGSVALALRARGWHVAGTDINPVVTARAVAMGAIDSDEIDADAEVTFVATNPAALVDALKRALAETNGLVTDVGSVKASVVSAIDDRRFIGGHPMAGSELDGLDGAHAEMFEGAVWVLTPTAVTSDSVFGAVASIVASLGAEVVALPPDRHDELVAVVSHVPHLAAAALMTVADARSVEHGALLRLAAGGFRDMTRIAAGQPAIWIDICSENRTAIVDGLDSLIAGLSDIRRLVSRSDSEGLHDVLQRARAARTNLPSRMGRPEDLIEVRIPIPDRPGAAAEIFTLAAELGVNIADFEVFHSAEGTTGVMILLVEATVGELFRGGLIARGYRPGLQRLT